MNPVRNSLFVNAKLVQTVVCLLMGNNKDVLVEYHYLTNWSQNLHWSLSLKDCQHKNIFYKASLAAFINVCEFVLWADLVILLFPQNTLIFYIIMILLIYSRGRKRGSLVQMQILLTYLCKSQKILTNIIHSCPNLTSSGTYDAINTKPTHYSNKEVYCLKKWSSQLISDRLSSF